MDKKSKILILVFLLLIIGSVGATYYRIFVKKDYIISAQPDCDPATEKCFISVCDPTSGDCTGNPEEDTFYFKKIKKKAANVAMCDPNQKECQSLECAPGEKDCEIIYCDKDTLSEGETCNDPEQYVKDHPEGDAGAAVDCDPAKEDCNEVYENSSEGVEGSDELPPTDNNSSDSGTNADANKG